MGRKLELSCVILIFTWIMLAGTRGNPFMYDSSTEAPSLDLSASELESVIKSLEDVVPERSQKPRKFAYGQNYEDKLKRTDGKMLFGDDEPETKEQPEQFVPSPKPTCNFTFCEDAPNYPTTLVETALRMNRHLKYISGADLVPDISHRSRKSEDDVPLCQSDERIVFPKIAQNKNKQWLYILNQGDFMQGVRIETCRRPNKPCDLIEGFAERYTTVCREKVMYRQLVAVFPNGQIKASMFRFPASCCCRIVFNKNPLLRMNTSPKQGQRSGISTRMH